MSGTSQEHCYTFRQCWHTWSFCVPAYEQFRSKKQRTWYSISLVSMLFSGCFSHFFCHSFLSAFRPYGRKTFFFHFTAIVLILLLGAMGNFSEQFGIWTTRRKTELIGKKCRVPTEPACAGKRRRNWWPKTIRHDFRHHNQNIAALLQKGDVKEALRYVKQYDESLKAAKPIGFLSAHNC